MIDDELNFSLIKCLNIIIAIIISIVIATCKQVYAMNYINSDEMVNIYVDAYKVSLDNISVGYVSNNDEGKKILEIIERRLVKKLSLNKEEINSISIDANICYENKSVKLKDISSYEEIVDNIEILNNSMNKPLIQTDVKVKNKVVVNIESPINVIHTGDLYLWESRIEEGLDGKKEVMKIDSFINGRLEDTNIIKEKILFNPKETIIYKGSKDPIITGNTFLTQPTRGGDITSNFGRRKSGNHSGIDIAQKLGAPIEAACDGNVVYTGWDNIYGNMVIIKHSTGIETLYAHASEILVKEGEKVQRGDTIAKVGNTGRSTGPHLHFELRYNGNAINPQKFLY